MNLPYDRETMIAYLDEGKCPYCERSGYKKIGTHISKKHGIPFLEIKDALLIRQSKGFCDPALRELLRENALKSFKSGFGYKKGEGRAKGHKKTDVEIQKQKLAWENNPEWQNYMRNLIHHPEFKARSTETRKNNGTFKMIGQQRSLSVLGTIEGYADEVYVGFAIDFIGVINETRGWGAYVRTGKKWGVHETSAKKRINVSVKRGLLTITGVHDSLRAELTEKAKEILLTPSNENNQKYVDEFVERYRKVNSTE